MNSQYCELCVGPGKINQIKWLNPKKTLKLLKTVFLDNKSDKWYQLYSEIMLPEKNLKYWY